MTSDRQAQSLKTAIRVENSLTNHPATPAITSIPEKIPTGTTIPSCLLVFSSSSCDMFRLFTEQINITAIVGNCLWIFSQSTLKFAETNLNITSKKSHYWLAFKIFVIGHEDETWAPIGGCLRSNSAKHWLSSNVSEVPHCRNGWVVSRMVGIKIRSGLHEYHYQSHRSTGDNKKCGVLGASAILEMQNPRTNYANTRKSYNTYLVNSIKYGPI